MSSRRVELIPIASLAPWARNARTHSKKQVRQIADSIARFGFTNPVLIDQERRILAGHGRVAAAKLLGWTEAPCLFVEAMSDEDKRAYVIADNKLALNAGWDEDLLADELKELMRLDPSFDLTITGFSIPEIDALVEGLEPVEDDDPADERLPPAPPRRCQPGDLWALGPHRLLCADGLDPENVAALMAHERADMVFTDPPYNVPIDGHVSGLGSVKHREFAQASGEMSATEFTAFLRKAFVALANNSADGSIHFICMDWRHMGEVLAASGGVYAELKNLIVWAKDNAGMGTFYRSRHELIFAFKNGTAPHVNAFELGQHGRHRSNVWTYRGANSFQAGRGETLAMHPTVKPVAMIADAIRDVSRRGGLVLDLFGGSGSTLIAAHKTGRRARLVELDPLYCDVILARYEAFAKDEAERIREGVGRQTPTQTCALSAGSPVTIAADGPHAE